MNTKILAISSGKTQWIEIGQVTMIGGAKSQGHKLPGLKNTEDYALCVSKGDSILIQPLIGKNREAFDLNVNSGIEILDLKLFFPSQLEAQSENSTLSSRQVLQKLDKFIQDVIKEPLLENKMDGLLLSMIELNELEKGFVTVRNVEGKFQIVSSHGVKADDPWLSESFLKQTLASKDPLAVQNLIGSKFENNRSLMATGFISVFSWPLMVNDECLGAIVLGSARPHGGLSEIQKTTGQLLSLLGAAMLQQILQVEKLSFELKAVREALRPREEPFLSQDPRMTKLSEVARRVAHSELSILIQGETGTGKEMLAQWIHQNGPTPAGPFVALNCGAIPENLVESVLFGHRKGSFTGALQDQTGKFQQAHRGTLFLDEVGDLPLSSQVKLLRALQEKQIEPLGGGRPVPVQVRVVAASHKNISQLVKDKKFREDLYFRLAEMTLEIPPLRERPRDIPLLVSEFLQKTNAKKKLSSAAWAWVQAQPWRGNVRELLSSVKRAQVLSSATEITVQDFLTGTSTSSDSADRWLDGKNLEEAVSNFQKAKVRMALDLADGHRGRAAEMLGITPRTLFRYLEDLRETVTDLS